ncbi:IS5/IS1182 family transposase, partial [Streptomyces vinaceus]
MVFSRITPTTEASLVPYSASLDVSHELVEHVSWLICERRRELNSPWRRLGCFKQALLALAHPRKNETFAR